MPEKGSMNANIVINNQKYPAQSTFASIIWKYTMKVAWRQELPALTS